MAKKAVSFSTEATSSGTARGFKTWPKRAIKYGRTKAAAGSRRASSKESMESLIEDVYCRFRKLEGANVERCLQYIISGDCKDVLVSYAVLNTILKNSTSTSEADDEQQSASPVDNLHFDYVSMIARANADFDKFCESTDVLDARIIQQIMRAVETVWTRCAVPKPECGQLLSEFAHKCINLIHSRPGSKLLLSPAVRISNIALEESLLTSDQIKQLITALARTHFVFAASFTAEVMIVLATVQRVHSDILKETMNVWVPLAVRALVSSSSLTRSLALHLLKSCDAQDDACVAQTLSESSEPQRDESEQHEYQPQPQQQLAKTMMRKFALLVSNSNSGPSDDAKHVVESLCLILESAAKTPGPCAFLDYYLDIERLAFGINPKLVSIVWSTLISVQKTHPSYRKVLLVAFGSSAAANLPVGKMLSEAVSTVDCTQPSSWNEFTSPLFKSLADRKDAGVLETWAGLIPTMKLVQEKVLEYLDILGQLSKHVGQQNVSSFEAIWVKIAECCSGSRSTAINMVRFHYNILSQNAAASALLSLPLTNGLVRTWPFAFLIERPKNASSILPLILHPVMVFVPAERQGEYLDKVLANCKSDGTLRHMLTSLLRAVHIGQEDSLRKWMVAGSTILEYVGANRDTASASVCVDALLSFLPIMRKASSTNWSLWFKLFSASPVGREKVTAKITDVPLLGLKCILHIPGYHSDKIRILAATISSGSDANENKAFTMVKQANLPSELVDNVARELITRKRFDAARWAFELVNPGRVFVIAKPLLQAIDESHADDLVKFWNSKLVPSFGTSPAFISKPFADRLARDLPEINIPSAMIITPVTQPLLPADIAAITPPKRFASDNSPASNKRPRRTILTGSVPPSLSTPPVSSDPPEEASGTPSDDLLCSSPPQRQKSAGGGPLTSSSWRTSQQERARALKRVMMGLDMDEAVQDMKRSEQEMIYNLMFRSCVKLRTHLAATGPSLPESQVKEAGEKLEAATKRHEALLVAENMMIENGRRRKLEYDSQESVTDSDDSDDVDGLEEDDDEFVDSRPIKLEV